MDERLQDVLAAMIRQALIDAQADYHCPRHFEARTFLELAGLDHLIGQRVRHAPRDKKQSREGRADAEAVHELCPF